jgi:uncharacterized protein
MRLVIDTNIVVSGTFWRGAPWRLLRQLELGHAIACSSPILLEELADVLLRDKFDERFAAAQTTAMQVFLAFADECELFDAIPLPEPIAPDPDDDWVIATALCANADLIVTGDKPFLELGRVGDVRIVTVAEALALIEQT